MTRLLLFTAFLFTSWPTIVRADALPEGLEVHGPPRLVVPQAPESAYRGPDRRIDLQGYAEIKAAILNHAGSCIFVIAMTEGERFSDRQMHLLEIDTELGQVVRRLPLPEREGRFELTGIDTDTAGSVLVITGKRSPPPPEKQGDAPRVVAVPRDLPRDQGSEWEMHCYDLRSGEISAERQLTIPLVDSAPRWRVDPTGRCVWVFKWTDTGRELERWPIDTLEPVRVYSADQLADAAASDDFQHKRRVGWTATLEPHLLRLVYPDPAVSEIKTPDGDRVFGQRYEQIDLDTGQAVQRLYLSRQPRIFGDHFSGNGTMAVGIEDSDGQVPADGPARVWDLSGGHPLVDVASPWLDIFSLPRLSHDGRFLQVHLSNSSRTVVLVWRLDLQSTQWSWPRRIDFTHGFGARSFSGDGRHMLAYNEVERRRDRILIYHFADDERYDHALAQELDRQHARPAPAVFPEPTHQLKAPMPGEDIRGADRLIKLDRDVRIERVAVTPDGREAFALAVDTFPIDTGRGVASGVRNGARVSILRIDLDGGKVLDSIELPESDNKYVMDRHSLLGVSASGRSLVCSFWNRKPDMAVVDGAVKLTNPAVFYRWDARTGALTHQKSDEAYSAMPWRMPASADAMLVAKFSTDGWALERWDTDDLSATPLASGKQVRDKPWPQLPDPTVLWKCAELREDGRRLSVILMRSGMGRGNNDPTTQYWLQHYDTSTGRPEGRGIELDNASGTWPHRLRGEHLVFRYDARDDSLPRRAARIWSLAEHEHAAQIDLDNYQGGGDVWLADDGGAVFVNTAGKATGYIFARLDLRTLRWSAVRSLPGSYMTSHWAATPDGRRVVILTESGFDYGAAHTGLAVYDFD